MSLITAIQAWWARRVISRRYRYPALAEANKALLAVEAFIADFDSIKSQMEEFRAAQSVSEHDRDQVLIPIYLSLEKFVASHGPPTVKTPISQTHLRAKIGSELNLSQMNPGFRLIFLSETEQIDQLLKIGILDILKFLLTSLGRLQLESLARQAGTGTALADITISDDGISFEPVHRHFDGQPKDVIIKAYQRFYNAIFKEIANLFGQQEAIELFMVEAKKIESIYDGDFIKTYRLVLPSPVKTMSV